MTLLRPVDTISYLRGNNLTLKQDQVYVKTDYGTQRFQVAPLKLAIPYYKQFSRQPELHLASKWPVLITRRFLAEFNKPIAIYIARPSRNNLSALLHNIELVIQKVVKPPGSYK